MSDTWIITHTDEIELGGCITSKMSISVDNSTSTAVDACYVENCPVLCSPAETCAEGESLQPQSYFQLQ